MNGITFAEPLFLYLLLIVPAMTGFYIFKQQKASASLHMPGLQPFEKTGPTFRNYLRHILFAMRAVAITLLIIIIARPQKTDQLQDVSTEGLDIVLALDISGACWPVILSLTDLKPQRMWLQSSSPEGLTTAWDWWCSAVKVLPSVRLQPTMLF
jgi:Ca-activated chloride channel family protein